MVSMLIMVGHSRKAWIRITPPANKLSGEDPDGPLSLARLPRNDSKAGSSEQSAKRQLPRNDTGGWA